MPILPSSRIVMLPASLPFLHWNHPAIKVHYTDLILLMRGPPCLTDNLPVVSHKFHSSSHNLEHFVNQSLRKTAFPRKFVALKVCTMFCSERVLSRQHWLNCSSNRELNSKPSIDQFILFQLNTSYPSLHGSIALWCKPSFTASFMVSPI